jgi:hypothetical protein
MLLMASLRGRFAILLGLACAVGCDKQLSADECNALLDHYVTVLADSDRPGSSETELIRLRAEARAKAARDPAFSRCASQVSRSKFECAMQASSSDRLEQCLL